MITVPDRLLELPSVRIRYQDSDLLVLEKELTEPLYGRESYLNRHVVSVVLSGQQRIESEDGSVVRIRAGEAAVLARGIYTVTDLLAEGGTFRVLLFYFGAALLRRLAPAIAPVSTRTWARTPVQMEQIRQLVSHSIDRTRSLLFLQSLPPLTQLHQSPRRRSILPFLEAHYDKSLTLEDFAYLTGRSVSTFQRGFRKQTGESPRKWIIRRRMERARELLTAGLRSDVAGLAAQVGYQNTSHFIKTYKSFYGVTPGNVER